MRLGDLRALRGELLKTLLRIVYRVLISAVGRLGISWVFLRRNEDTLKHEIHTLASSHSSLSLSFSSRSSVSRSESHLRSFSSLSIIESFSRSFFSSSFLVVVSDANWRSSEACASCEVNACVRCCRFAVECWGSIRNLDETVIQYGVRYTSVPRSSSAINESLLTAEERNEGPGLTRLGGPGRPSLSILRISCYALQPGGA